MKIISKIFGYEDKEKTLIEAVLDEIGAENMARAKAGDKYWRGRVAKAMRRETKRRLKAAGQIR